MANIRTMKLNLLADVSQFGKGLGKAEKQTETFSGKVGRYSKAMAKSFALAGAAAGAYAIKLGVDGVKSAIEDELSQKKLAQALKNTTKATDAQIASTEDYIGKQQLQFGIADTKLRPALANLARATGDLTKAQKLNNLAIDISAATGKDLETVSMALAKAYGGNVGALKKLGVPLDENIIKTKDFEAATDQLQKLFGGSAAANTKTLQGQLAILRETFGELQEGVGVKVLPVLKRLAEQTIMVAKAFSGKDPDGLSARARELKGDMGDGGEGSLGRSLKSVADSFVLLFKAVTDDGDEATSTMEDIAKALRSVANGINAVATAYSNAKKLGGRILGWLDVSDAPKFADTDLGRYLGYTARAAGGPVSPGQAYRVGEFGPEMFVPSGSGSIRPAGGGGSTIINLNGIVDAESARRSIERLLQNSSKRTGAINLAGSSL
jgi:uncharacterized protein (UPF0264 family)